MKKFTINDIALLCKMLRTRTGVRQKDIADDLGVTVSSISYFESGCTNNAEYLFYYLVRFGLLEIPETDVGIDDACIADATLDAVAESMKMRGDQDG